ncbi:MAG: tetratricopeptide repeat protein [Bacteroidales bacterium]|nr:tetratricopeptide repeat protein [Bacteroidales bacterium]
MHKHYFIIAALLSFSSATVLSQISDPQTNRWLLQNPTSANRGEVLLQEGLQQIGENGRYSLAPFESPKLLQLKPEVQHLQLFLDGQNQLDSITSHDFSKFSDREVAALRKRYQTLYNMNDPRYREEAEYYLGYIDYADGKYESALNHFDALPVENKYQETVPYYRMQILFAQGKWEEAIQAIDTYVPQNQAYQLEALRIKGECQLQNGNLVEARNTFRKYLEETENPLPASAYNAGILEYDAENYAQAAKYAQIGTQATHPQLKQLSYMLVGNSMLQLDQSQQALLAFEQAATIEDGNQEVKEAAAYNVCAVSYSTKSNLYGDEIKLLENFLNTYPTSKYADLVSGYMVDIYSTTRNYESALQSIEKIKQPSPSILKAKQHIYYQLGVQHYLNGEYEEAKAQFNRSVQMGNFDPVVWSESMFWRGESRFHLSSYQEAIDDYKLFLRQKQTRSQSDLLAAAYYSMGYAQMMLSDFSSAIHSFSTYIAQPKERGTQGYVDGMLRLADCYYYTRQFHTAEGYYHTASDYESNQLDYALFQEALMMGLQKRYAEKQDRLDELITNCEQSDLVDDAWLDKGRTSLLQNAAPQAITYFQQVLDNYPESPIAPMAAVELAMTYNNLGQTEAAQKIYQLVAERYPDTEAAQTAAEDLHTLGVQQNIAELPKLYEAGKYQQLLDAYRQLQSENIDFRDAQTMRLLAGKSHLALNQQKEALKLLEEAAQELRTASGSEAKYLIAETYFLNGQLPEAQQCASELIQSGTPHQYWLARAIILTSDIMRRQDDTFTADEYLKSLQQNYQGKNDDIATRIAERLSTSH